MVKTADKELFSPAFGSFLPSSEPRLFARQKCAVSKKDLDDAGGIEQAAHASMAAAHAVVDKAKLDLEFTRIVSPIDGIAGIARTQIGNLVGPGSVDELAMVSTVDPIKEVAPTGMKRDVMQELAPACDSSRLKRKDEQIGIECLAKPESSTRISP